MTKIRIVRFDPMRPYNSEESPNQAPLRAKPGSEDKRYAAMLSDSKLGRLRISASTASRPEVIPWTSSRNSAVSHYHAPVAVWPASFMAPSDSV